MTFRVRHEWPAKSTRIVDAELVTCPHCHTLRVTAADGSIRYLRRVPCLVCHEDPKRPHDCERERTAEPPCIEPPPPPLRAGRGAAFLRAVALDRMKRAALDQDREPE